MRRHRRKKNKWKWFVFLVVIISTGTYFYIQGNEIFPGRNHIAEHRENNAEKQYAKTPYTIISPNTILSMPNINYKKLFCDNNDTQIVAAQTNGITKFQSRKDFIETSELMKMNSCALYEIDSLTHSMPYLVPIARLLLDDIAIHFQQLLSQNHPNNNYRLIVTSILRTQDDVTRLRKRNRNASENSCHCYGTTFDISHRRFDKLSGTDVNDQILKHTLAQVLYELRKMGRCYVKYEGRQGCFHITVRTSNIEKNIFDMQYWHALLSKYKYAEDGNFSDNNPHNQAHETRNVIVEQFVSNKKITKQEASSKLKPVFQEEIITESKKEPNPKVSPSKTYHPPLF